MNNRDTHKCLTYVSHFSLNLEVSSSDLASDVTIIHLSISWLPFNTSIAWEDFR